MVKHKTISNTDLTSAPAHFASRFPFYIFFMPEL